MNEVLSDYINQPAAFDAKYRCIFLSLALYRCGYTGNTFTDSRGINWSCVWNIKINAH